MFDINARLGPWPYRPVRGIDALLESMDALGVKRAIVSSLEAAHFLNPQDGNEALAARIAAHRDRFVPFAAIRPNFARWEDDLAHDLDDLDMRGVVLYPNYHDLPLDAPELAPLMRIAEARRIPVCVQAGLEDLRRQYRPYKTPEVPPEAIGAFARAYPAVTVSALGLKFGQPEQMGEPLPDNLYFDTSNYETLNELETAVRRFGPEKMLYGSNFPLFNPRANADKLRAANLTHAAREAIGFRNAERLLRMERSE